MLTFTIVTDTAAFLVVRVPSGSVAIYERSDDTTRRRVPVALSDMSDAISYIADRLDERSEKNFSAVYHSFCFAYTGCGVVFLPQKVINITDCREALERCVDYLTDKEGTSHAVD